MLTQSEPLSSPGALPLNAFPSRPSEASTIALAASEAERTRIARELHDDTAQQLAALLMRLRVVERQVDPRTVELLRPFREELVACAEGVRRIARALRPPELDEGGIVFALRSHARALRDGTDFTVEIDTEPVDDALDDAARLVLYRIVQEALSNAVRHSGSTSAHVSLRGNDDVVEARVEDAGRGFTSRASSTPGGGLGLVGMEERAALIGGRVRIESDPGKGTRVIVTLPARRARAHRRTSPVPERCTEITEPERASTITSPLRRAASRNSST